MIIVIILAVLTVLGIVLERKTEAIGGLIIILCGGLLLVAVIAKLGFSIETHGKISEFQATNTTIEQARQNGIDLENAAIQHKIIESNQWLANRQYYNSTIFGWWIPDEVDRLGPIK